MVVDPITTTWTAVPTAILDVYDVKRQVTHEVDTPVLELGMRIVVFNPFTQNYGWIEADGVGPVLGP